MKKNILAVFLFCVVTVSGQPKAKSVYFEIHQMPSGSLTSVFVLYRIPYNEIVFVKNDENYLSGLSVGVEAVQENNVISRQISKKNISVEKYAETKSPLLSVQGLITLNLKPGQYNLIPEISIEHSDVNVKLKPIPVEVVSDTNTSVLKPVVVQNKDSSNFIVVNYSNYIPYSKNNFGLIIPVKDSSKINVIVKQDSSTLLDTSVNKASYKNLSFVELNNNIELRPSGNSNYNFYYVSGFTNKLLEGNVAVKIKSGNTEKEFKLEVFWVDKPLSLYNPEFAVKLLRIIGKDEIVSKIFSYPKSQYYRQLVNFWNSEFKSNGYKFNDAMNEFYSRADYAIKNFNYLGQRNGARTDRGKVYIKYGEPTEISRSYSEKNEVLEIWKYKNLNKQFVFVDRTGTGDFDLLGKK